jgi:hypothetical protein
MLEIVSDMRLIEAESLEVEPSVEDARSALNVVVL